MKKSFSAAVSILFLYSTAFAQDKPIAYRILELMPKVHIDGMTPFKMPPPEKPARDTVSITVIGDVMLHQSQIDNCRERFAKARGEADSDSHDDFDFSPYFEGIRDILHDADICIANMEFTLAGPPFSGYPAFCAPDSYAQYVADCGVDVFLTANNHILDKGHKGIVRTLDMYSRMKEASGVLNTGCFSDSTAMAEGYPLFVEAKGMKIALINFTYGTNVDIGEEYPKVCLTDTLEIAAAMRKARNGADLVIALPHWGIEYDLKHSANQRKTAEFLVRHGADAIIGAHPHVVQDIEYIAFEDSSGKTRTVPVVYSLGNIISNMSAANTQIGLIVTLEMTRDSEGQAMLLEPRYMLTWCSLPGRLADSHVTIPVRSYLERSDEWADRSDHDRMKNTYERILRTSGIKEEPELKIEAK